jgi:hypothetical protein
VTRNTSLFWAEIVLLGWICFFFEVGGANAQSDDSNGPTSGRIVFIDPKEPKGNLKVRQAKGLGPIDATVNMLVLRGHLLILNPTARATIICGDGKKRELMPGPHGCPCTVPCTREVCGINYNGSTLASTRGPDTNAGLFPVVISPRKTLVLNTRPNIRWSPIAGAKESTTYNVTLYGENMKVVWTRDVVSTTMLAYPDKEPALTPGQTYKVVVASEGMSSDQDHSPGLGFTTLTSHEARALANDETKRKQGLPEAQTRFTISNLYAARELYSEAIEQLEDQFTTMREPAAAKMLGDLYATIGLNREAEKKYLEALSLTPANDLDELGLIGKNLAQVYENLGMFERAIARLQEARKAYQRLRNRAIVNALLKDERRLKKPQGRR